MSVTAVPLRPVQKGTVLKLWLGLGALGLAAAAVAWAGTDELRTKSPALYLANNGERPGVVTTPSGVQIEVLRAGSGPRIGVHDGVIIDYEGRLTDGTVFDSTAGKGPAPMLVGQVVPGFSEALQMMQPQGRYRIWLPPELAYGNDVPPGGPIPPNAVLEFDVSVAQVVPNAALMQMEGPQGPPPAQSGM